jgi:hypothetical protein
MYMPGSHFSGRDLLNMPLRRSSENPQKAKFADFSFHALR